MYYATLSTTLLLNRIYLINLIWSLLKTMKDGTTYINSLVVDYGYPIGYSYKKDTRGYLDKVERKKELALLSIKRVILRAV